MTTQTPTTAHLTDADIAAIGSELDAIRESVLQSRGASDAEYIHRVIATQRRLELGGRGLLQFSLLPPAWLAGTALLATSKILENMEIGHNVMHGQWDWMQDPEIHSTTWEWDNVSAAEGWKYTHNYIHHTYTNVVGKDRDVGYAILRVSDDQPWRPWHLPQLGYNFALGVLFQWGVALHDLEAEKVWTGEKKPLDVVRGLGSIVRKARKQFTKDYLLFPLLAGPSAVPTLLGNLTANVTRNMWSHMVIMCGHFPEGVEDFVEEQLEGESRGEWYVRQLLGSANIEGSPLMHVMTGNLSHQIEHHLFPDLPSNRYAEIAPQVRELCERYGLPYTAGSLVHQYASVLKVIARHSLPGPAPREATVTDRTVEAQAAA
jgi:NADPH-dependent stearoyl-CoA 9-desaturase